MNKELFINHVKRFIKYNKRIDQLLNLLGTSSEVLDDSLSGWSEALIVSVNPNLKPNTIEDAYFYETFFKLIADGDISEFKDFYDRLLTGEVDPSYREKYGHLYKES